MADDKPGTTDMTKVLHPETYEDLKTLGDSIIRDHNRQKDDARQRRTNRAFERNDQ